MTGAQMADDRPFEAPRGGHAMDAETWSRARFGWLESVRRDASLNLTARLVAHVLALDFANHNTMQCNPSHEEIGAVIGTSADTAKRAVLALMEAGWIARRAGRGRGHRSGYLFLTRAQVVALKPAARTIKGGKSAPSKGGTDAAFSETQKGANLHGKGGKSAPRYNIAKPYKNHSAGEMAISEADLRRAKAIKAGDREAVRYLSEIDFRHLVLAGLVTPDDLRRVGVDTS